MSDQCNHDCGNCSKSNCGDRDMREKLNQFSKVDKVIAVVSGKGGVGKSLVTSLLATAMQKRGKVTAIMDADITGPSIPKAFGLKGRLDGTDSGIYPAITRTGIQAVSLTFFLENPTDPVVWRGPVIAGCVKQFWTDMIWNDVDYMFVDMPPGTGDVPLTVFQSIPVSGIVVVTSPQELVSDIVEKATKMANLMNIPILGIVENMAYFDCPDCGKRHYIYGKSNVEKLAKDYNIPVTAGLPINPDYARLVDAGRVEEANTAPLDQLLDSFEKLK